MFEERSLTFIHQNLGLGVHHIHGGYSLALGVLGVGNSITDHVLQKDLENTAGLFVNQT